MLKIYALIELRPLGGKREDTFKRFQFQCKQTKYKLAFTIKTAFRSQKGVLKSTLLYKKSKEIYKKSQIAFISRGLRNKLIGQAAGIS